MSVYELSKHDPDFLSSFLLYDSIARSNGCNLNVKNKDGKFIIRNGLTREAT